METPLITLTSDFGNRDGFVGTMKGVILKLNPRARLVDISHDIPAQDIVAGAMVLRNACPWFPAGTIHLAVIDPGVGSQRKAMIACSERACYVLPDNGLIGLLAREEAILRCFAIENPDWCLAQISTTFHGRDIFAPAAAMLSLGRDPATAGPVLPAWQDLAWPEPQRLGDTLEAKVVYRDIYGNLFTNLRQRDLADSQWSWEWQGHHITGPHLTYSSLPADQPLFLIGSSGFLELAINGGSAARFFGLEVGSSLFLRRLPPSHR